MCRGKRSCTELGALHTWNSHSPLKPPEWMRKDILNLGAAARLKAEGHAAEAAAIVSALREAEAREWFVEHAQVAGNHRQRVLQKPRPSKVSDNRISTPERIKRQIWERDGHSCRYCGLPTIPPKVMRVVRTLLGEDVLPWGTTNASRHGTLVIARAEYDHVIPVSAGGSNGTENLVTSCPSCNYGKDRWTLEELGMEDPFARPPVRTDWDGLLSLAEPSGRPAPSADPKAVEITATVEIRKGAAHRSGPVADESQGVSTPTEGAFPQIDENGVRISATRARRYQGSSSMHEIREEVSRDVYRVIEKNFNFDYLRKNAIQLAAERPGRAFYVYEIPTNLRRFRAKKEAPPASGSRGILIAFALVVIALLTLL